MPNQTINENIIKSYKAYLSKIDNMPALLEALKDIKIAFDIVLSKKQSLYVVKCCLSNLSKRMNEVG